jgi:hypothetical protein
VQFNGRFVQGWEYKMEVSILEIYNEALRDLLASPADVKNLSYEIKLTDARSAHTHVTNLRVGAPICCIEPCGYPTVWHRAVWVPHFRASN